MSEVERHEEIEDQFSDYYEGELDDDAKGKLQKHLAECDGCKASYEEFKETFEAISGFGKVAAPVGFEKDVEQTISTRSAGRFFGERSLTDRLPLTIIALTAIAIGAILYFFVLRGSETGSLKGSGPEPDKPVDQEVIPQP